MSLNRLNEGGRIGLLPVVNIVGLGSPISGCTMLVFPRMRGGRGECIRNIRAFLQIVHY